MQETNDAIIVGTTIAMVKIVVNFSKGLQKILLKFRKDFLVGSEYLVDMLMEILCSTTDVRIESSRDLRVATYDWKEYVSSSKKKSCIGNSLLGFPSKCVFAIFPSPLDKKLLEHTFSEYSCIADQPICSQLHSSCFEYILHYRCYQTYYKFFSQS